MTSNAGKGLFDDDEDLFTSAVAEPPPLNKSVSHPDSDDLFEDVKDEIDLNDDFSRPRLEIATNGDDAPGLVVDPTQNSTSSVPTTPLMTPTDSPIVPSHSDNEPASLPIPSSTVEKPSAAEIDITPTNEQPASSPAPTNILSSPTSSLPSNVSRHKHEEEHEEVIDVEPKLNISISGYDKRGDGMNSYVVFKVVTKTLSNQQVPGYTKREYDVWRRFSDFLGLHDKLNSKHLQNGRIVPAAPEKNVLGTTKTKISKTVEEDHGANEFLERRRAALERFVRRCAQHPIILQDPDFREFLTLESDLPKSSQTAALSGASVMRLLGRVGDSFTKITARMDDSDQWFHDKQCEIDELDEQLKKLHLAVENLVTQRRDLSASTESFCKGLSLLAACEENTSLSKALSVLSETMEKVALSHQDQADKDLYLFAEVLKDYIALIVSVREVFHERMKTWQAWQTAQLTLAKKRENKTRIELAGKSDKLPAAKKEVQEAEQKVQEYEEHFEKLSKMIRKEVRRFDAQRVRDFKTTLLQYLEALAASQQQLVKYWDAFLPEAKGIAA